MTMSGKEDFIRAAAETYQAANAATLNWILDRGLLHGCFLNTKLNPITLEDYAPGEGMRGPDFTYGWIQGRGLEALATYAAFLEPTDPALAVRADVAGRKLYEGLRDLQAGTGHGYFCYDKDMRPVYPAVDFEKTGKIVLQNAPGDIYTYSDAFFAKGLVAASARYAPKEQPAHLAYLDRVIAAIEAGRFQMAERSALSQAGLEAQDDDYGPRMILLGAASMLSRLGLGEHTGFAERFIAHVLEHHLDKATSLLRNVPGGNVCNPGHSIEFVGFALAHLGTKVAPQMAEQLQQILLASFRAGFVGPGIAISVDIASGKPINDHCPWWSLPETIRSAALMYQVTKSPEVLAVWNRGHEAFFTSYWRGEPAIAYQTLSQQGPESYIPSTPDLDPLYHTGLSLLAAIKVAPTVKSD